LIVVVSGAKASAQSLARFTIDSVVSVDAFRGENVNDRPQVVVDVSTALRVTDRWQVVFRPWFRLPRPRTPTAPAVPWDKQLWQAGVRYERPGPVAARIDAGYMVSPIGIGLIDARPNLNPTIMQHLTYVVPMPAFDPTVRAQVSPVSSSYPLGTQLTLSTDRWDARAALVNSAPARNFAWGSPTTPKQTPVFEAGAGVTPTAGLRLGGSVGHGRYATSEEVTRPASGGYVMTLVSSEVEYAFRYTKVTGEFVRSAFETSTVSAIGYEWFVQGIQTLSPRWFVAGRQEGASAPPLRTGSTVGSRTTFKNVETTAGFRVTPDITLRTSYFARKSYNARAWDNQVGASVVWAQRWW
jgi:hypothetical protein